MPGDTIPIFLNGAPLWVPPGASLSQVLADHDPELFALLLGRDARAVDGRGLPLDPDGPLVAGAIVRVMTSSRRDDIGHA